MAATIDATNIIELSCEYISWTPAGGEEKRRRHEELSVTIVLFVE